MQLMFALTHSSSPNIAKAEKELFFSVQKTYDLYHYILLLLVDIRQQAANRIAAGRQKRLPTAQDLAPNTKFVDNRAIQQLEDSKKFNDYVFINKLSWINYPNLIKNLYLEILESEIYKTYMESGNDSFEEDAEFVVQILEQIIYPSELLDHTLEEQSIFWNDDLEFVVSMVVKSVKQFKEGATEIPLHQLFKNEEDRDFAKNLFRKTAVNFEYFKELIDRHTDNWELERIAAMDIVLIQMAINEFIEFPSIPTKVTINEYIEISKFYSSEKSSTFINGVLDKVLKELKTQDKVRKQGRGLQGEI